ncbi:MAG TPA: Crp/Fnr family transcriptional regulator [Candidatus Sulfotelmatobacter sp.]|nr:Crp/Fnr family transcriptional regulator [Candidatus Sulfotelmatobacter sp.]
MASRRQAPTRRLTTRKLSARFDPAVFLANAGIGKTIHEYAPKAAIFSQGEIADSVFYIQKGRVRLSVVSKQGKEAVLGLFGPGDFMGEGCIASDQPIRMATATATTPCSALKIEKRQMLRTLHAQHEFSDVFVAYLVARNSRTQEDLVDQLFNSSEKRLARALFLLANFGKDRSEKMVPSISQETLAEMIGTTRSRVNFFMNRFKKLGLIEYNGGLLVHSSLLSVVLHD